MSLAFTHLVPKVRRFPHPLLFIHGMCGVKESWIATQRIGRALGFESYALDLQSGITAIDLYKTTLEDYYRNVERMLDVIGEPVVLYAHSMGGLIAQVIANRHPGRIAGAVLLTSASPQGALGLSFNLTGMLFRWDYIWSVLYGVPLMPKHSDALALGLPKKTPHFADFVPESGWVVRQLVFGTHVEPLRIPVLVVAAGKDKLIRKKAQEWLATYHGGRLLVLPDHGHMLMLEPGWLSSAKLIFAATKELFAGSSD